MPTLPKFVIHLDRLTDDVNRLSLLMNKFASEISSAGFYTPGFNFSIQSAALRVFPGELAFLIEKMVDETSDVDIFGNTFQGYESYQFVEIVVDSSFKTLTAIRLLGNTEEESEKQIRFALFDVPNTLFTPTTINTVSDIREISDGITEFFGGTNAPAARCGQDNNSLENIVGSLAENVFPESTVRSDMTWSGYLEQYVVPKVKTQPKPSTGLSRDELKGLLNKYESTSIKTEADRLAEEAEWSSVAFKGRVTASRQNAVDIVNASAEILADPEGLSAKIQTLGDAYSQILDKVSLGCLIKSAMECIIPPLTCKEILHGLSIENIEEKISLAFPNIPRLADRIKEESIKAKAENPDATAAADAFLNSIETFVDLEAICDAVSFAAGGGFQIPTIELPEVDIVDLFGSVEIAIEDAIMTALTTAIVEMITGVLDDLLSCDNLDAFVAGAINGEIPTDTALGSDLNKLFSEPTSLVDPEVGAIASSLAGRWENFVNKVDGLLENSVKVEIDAGADILGDVVQLRAQIDAAGGLEGLQEAIEGNIGKAASRAAFESFFQGHIDLTKLLRFSGDENADVLNFLVAEIGQFEISADKNSFTLDRINGEQTMVIFSALANAPASNLNVNGRDLANSIGLLLDDVAAILSPGDVLNLLAGTPKKKTVEVIIELIKISYEQISFINKPDEIITLFKTLGDLTGTSNIKDGVILASNVRRTRNIPRKFCPEDDEAIVLQEEILTRSFPPEEVRTIIDEIIEKRRLRYNDLGDILVRLDQDDFSPTEVLEPIICGLNPDGSRPPVVDDALDITINTMFEPTKMAFDREIPRYPDALSSEDKVTRTIPRTIRRSGNRPVFGAGAGSLFGSFNDFIGNLGLESPFGENGEIEEEVANPEWVKLVSDGMIPPEDDPGTPSDPLGPYTAGPPIQVQDVVKRVGSNFKRSFQFEDAVELQQADVNSFVVQIKGSLPVQSPVQDFSPYPAPSPEWVISYKEREQTLSLSLSANGSLYSTRFGRVQFSENFYFGEDFSRELSPDVRERSEELNSSINGNSSKPDVFVGLMQEKLRPAVKTSEIENFNNWSKSFFNDRYEEFVKSFMSNAGRRVANNRLLKKIPNRTLDNLGPGTSEFSSKEQAETLIINLINFSATPTDEQKRCKADPHLLDLEFIKSVVKDEYDKDCETENNNNGISRARGPINSSGYVGVVLTIIRLYVIEYVMRGLFVFDEYGYKTDFANDQLLISYIAFRLKRDIGRQGELAPGVRYYDAFETEMKIVYDKLVTNKEFDIPNEPLPEPSADGVPSELKVLVREQLKSVLEKVGDIIGINPKNVGNNLVQDLVSNIPVLDTYSDFEADSGFTSFNSRMDSLFEPIKKDSIPFPPSPLEPESIVIESDEGKYIVERYVRVTLSSDVSVAQEQGANGLHGVVNLQNWEEFIDNNPSIKEENISDLWEEPWRYGYRMVFVSPTLEDSRTKEQLNNVGKSFVLSGGNKVELKSSLSDVEKAFHVLEKEEKEVEDSTIIPPATFKQFNTVPISQVEIPIDDFGKVGEAEGKIKSLFQEKYAPSLIKDLANSLDSRTLFDYCFLSKRLVTFMLIQSSMVLNSEDMKFLFEGTKIELKRLFNALRNMGDYTSRNEEQLLNGVPGNAGAYKADFDQIGSPSGPRGPDAFYLASITPILIIRGLAEMSDPNIAVTAKVVAAGNSGYLIPKFVRNGDGTIKLSGTEEEPGQPVIQYSPIGVVAPDEFECIVRGSDEELPDFVENGTLVDWKSPDVPIIPGLPPLELPDLGQPLFIPRGPAGPNGIPLIYGLDRSPSAEDPNAIVASLPEFPGESVNLPYGLVSMALLPLQLFFPMLGPFTGPPYNMLIALGLDFLRLEPLIYQLPNYKFAFEKTDVAEELLAAEGIDLSGGSKVKCKDGTNPPTSEPEVLPPDPNLPPRSDNC